MVAVNLATARELNKTFLELVGKKCYQQFENRDRICEDCPVPEAFLTGKASSRERITFSPSKVKKELEIRGFPLLNEKREVIQVVVYRKDITEERNLQRLQRDAEKLTIVGQLATGLAHELKNQFAIVSGSVQFLRKNYGEDKAIKDYIEVIDRSVSKAELTIKRLLDFARPKEVQLAPIKIPLILEKACNLLRGECSRSRVKIKKRFFPQLPSALADGEQLEQVFVNLLLNAIQAMPKGGMITLVTDFDQEAGKVRIEIIDEGSGIPQEYRERIFEPFFTTRTEGTGLGLSFCQRSMAAQKGTIQVENASKGGTKIILTLLAHQMRVSNKTRNKPLRTRRIIQRAGRTSFREPV